MPEYRAVRAKVEDFIALCITPALAAEVTLQPIRRFGFDASILFSDILVHLPAMGLDLSFEKGEKGKGDGGPKIANPVRTRADVDALRIPDPARDLHQRDARRRAERQRRGEPQRIATDLRAEAIGRVHEEVEDSAVVPQVHGRGRPVARHISHKPGHRGGRRAPAAPPRARVREA